MKGTFTGTFVGNYKKSKSKKVLDSILDMEITDGEIDANFFLLNQSTNTNIDFKIFPVKDCVSINVNLGDENGFENQFVINLKQIELYNYQFKDCIYLEKNRIQGTLIGTINSYELIETKEKNGNQIISIIDDTDISTSEHLLGSGIAEKGKPKDIKPKKSIIFWLLAIASIISISSYTIYLNKNEQTTIVAEKDENFKREQLQKSRQYKDSLVHYLNLIKVFKNENNYKEALEKINQAKLFTSSSDTKILIQEANSIKTLQAEALFKKRKYKDAIAIYSSLIASNNFNFNYQYKRALCYSKLGKIKDAIKDLKSAVESNDKTAQQLYNKINPLKKRVAYYITRCCDGSTSNATGKGACSHHGGVCDWKEPVYETYREYE